nr:hypothetical protein [Tanacetum cinerariifolium]
MPLLAAMLSQDQEGEGAGVAAQAVPQNMPAPDQPQDHLSTPPRQQIFNPNAPKVNSLETELKDHNKLFKNVVGKLVKKVKVMEVEANASLSKTLLGDDVSEDNFPARMV